MVSRWSPEAPKTDNFLRPRKVQSKYLDTETAALDERMRASSYKLSSAPAQLAELCSSICQQQSDILTKYDALRTKFSILLSMSEGLDKNVAVDAYLDDFVPAYSSIQSDIMKMNAEIEAYNDQIQGLVSLFKIL